MCTDRADLAHNAAQCIAAEARRACAVRGRFAIALSGGTSPWPALELLAREPLDWRAWHVFQVDEREAPDGDAARNWTHVGASLLARVPIPEAQAHPMPVLEPDREAAAASYARRLPDAIDVVQLGLGTDGHTASLVPGDPVLAVADRDVAWCGAYAGRRRMTLTFPAIARARTVVWLVAGADKRAMLDRLLARDPSIPAGRVGRGIVFFAE